MGDMPISRRRILQGMAAGAGLTVVGGRSAFAGSLSSSSRLQAVVRKPGSRPDPSKPEGVDTLPAVEHIVIYMQENHSFDQYYGMLGRGDGYTLDASGKPTNSNPDANGNPVTVFPMPSTCDLTNGASQSWDASHISWDGGKMDGFIKAASGGTGSMGYWDGSTLPFYYALAKTFPLCDRWFCSVLAQTFPNRRYLQAATSLGIVSTDVSEIVATPSAPNGVIWDRLNDHGITWTDYAYDLPDILLFPDFYAQNKAHVKSFNQFLLDCENGALPQVSIVSPGDNTYTEESPADVQNGEAYSASIINAVMASPLWPKTAMFFMYDEHGGAYDHVPPPPAIAPDSIKPRIKPGDQPGGFDQYGVRVPGFVISPFAKKDYVSHVVHDHTSVLKFIETKFNLGAMTYRDANADDLMDCFDFQNPGFREPPTFPKPGLPASGSACQPLPVPPTKGNPKLSSAPLPDKAAPTVGTPTTVGGGSTTVPPTTAAAGSTPTTMTMPVSAGGSATPVSTTLPAQLAHTGVDRFTIPLAATGAVALAAGTAAVLGARQRLAVDPAPEDAPPPQS